MTKGKEVVEDGVCEPLNEPFEHRICNGETNELLLPTVLERSSMNVRLV